MGIGEDFIYTGNYQYQLIRLLYERRIVGVIIFKVGLARDSSMLISFFFFVLGYVINYLLMKYGSLCQHPHPRMRVMFDNLYVINTSNQNYS